MNFDYKKHVLISLIFGLLGLYAFLIADNIAITLWLSDHHHPILNWINLGITHLGDGITLICFTLILYFFRPFRVFLIGLFSISIHGAIIYLAKEYVFVGFDWKRPFGILNDKLNLIEGMTTHNCCTFPSGHTASGFVAAGLFCLAFGHYYNKKLWLWGYVFACAVGFSRLYLLQHWLRDVSIGAIVGIYSFLLAQFIIEKYGSSLEKLDFIRRLRKNKT